MQAVVTEDAAGHGRIETEVHDEYVAVLVRGELDMSNAPRLWARAREMFTTVGTRAVLLDLTDAHFLDSMTIVVLLQLTQDAARRGVRWGIVSGQDTIATRVLALDRATERLPLFGSMSTALASLTGDAK